MRFTSCCFLVDIWLLRNYLEAFRAAVSCGAPGHSQAWDAWHVAICSAVSFICFFFSSDFSINWTGTGPDEVHDVRDMLQCGLISPERLLMLLHVPSLCIIPWLIHQRDVSHMSNQPAESNPLLITLMFYFAPSVLFTSVPQKFDLDEQFSSLKWCTVEKQFENHWVKTPGENLKRNSGISWILPEGIDSCRILRLCIL